MPIEIKTAEAAANLIRSVAAMSAQAGKDVKGNAGLGYVGMIDGVVVKLATHYGERHGAAWRENERALQSGCKELRDSLRSALVFLENTKGLSDNRTLQRLSKELGTGGTGDVVEKSLLTRKMALAVAKDLAEIAGAPMTGLKGSDTIRCTAAKSVTKTLCSMADARDDFLRSVGDLLKKTVQPEEAEGPPAPTIRKTVTDEIKMMFAIKGGKLSLLEAPPGSPPAPDSFEACVAVLVAGECSSDAFRQAVRQLYQKLVVSKEWIGALDAVLRPEEMDVSKTEAPEETLLPDEAQRSFAIFKHLAKVFPPKNGKFECFHSWLAQAAADAVPKNIDDLTLDDVKKYVNGHLSKLPKDLGAVSTEKPAVTGFDYCLRQFFEDVSARNGGSLIAGLEGVLCDDASFARMLAQACTPRHREDLYYFDDNKLFHFGGGLFATNTNEFKLDGVDSSVTSVVAPKRKVGTPDRDQVLANFAATSIQKGDTTLFTALRFGSGALAGRTDSKGLGLHCAHYGQLIEQMLLLNPVKLAEAKLKDQIDLPVCRVDMADDPHLRQFAASYKIEIEGRTVTVRPQVLHFRIPTDSGVFPSEDPSSWLTMSKADVQSTQASLDGLLKMAEEYGKRDGADRRVKELSKQLSSAWRWLNATHGTEDGTIRLFKGFGSWMMKFGARISLLAAKLGNVPSFNCNGGRDRTGLMDVECKTLALWLDAGKDLPEITAGKDEMNAWRKQVLDGSGNQDIARQIKLNDDDMYMAQIHNKAKQAGANKNTEIPTADGEGREIWIEDRTFTSGLGAMYKV